MKFMEVVGKTIKWVEKEKKQIDKQNVAELKNVFTSDIISKLSPDAKAVVESILNSKEDIKDQVDTLLTDHIDEILTVLQKIDDEKWVTWTKDSSYEVFKSYVLENADTPEIRAKFESYNRLIPRKPKIYQAQIIAALGSGTFDKYGNTVLGRDVTRNGGTLSTTVDEKTIEMDLSKNPPTRSLGLSESEYKLPTKLPLGGFYEVLEKKWLLFEEAQKKYQGLEASQHNALQYVNDQDFHKQDISSIKTVLQKILWKKVYETLEIEYIDTKETIKNSLGLKVSALLEDFKNELEKEEYEYEKALSKQVKKYTKQIEKQDELTEKVLILLKNLWLDKLPLNQIIWDIESGILVIDLGISFDVGNINLAEGNFWESRSTTDSFEEFTERMVRFANTIYYRNPEGENEKWEQVWFSIDNYRNRPESQTKTETEISNALKKQWILSGTWYDIIKIRENLAKSNNQVQ